VFSLQALDPLYTWWFRVTRAESSSTTTRILIPILLVSSSLSRRGLHSRWLSSRPCLSASIPRPRSPLPSGHPLGWVDSASFRLGGPTRDQWPQSPYSFFDLSLFVWRQVLFVDLVAGLIISIYDHVMFFFKNTHGFLWNQQTKSGRPTYDGTSGGFTAFFLVSSVRSVRRSMQHCSQFIPMSYTFTQICTLFCLRSCLFPRYFHLRKMWVYMEIWYSHNTLKSLEILLPKILYCIGELLV
jgi:hypothetical protein